MHLLFRTLLLLFTSSRRSPLSIWDNSSLPLRVLPTAVSYTHLTLPTICSV